MQPADREAQFEQLLLSDSIAAHVLKAACLHGIPDSADLRAEAWRILLGVVDLDADGLPNDYAARKASKERKRLQYYDLAAELLGSQLLTPLENKTEQDNWLDDIDKDVRRTQTAYAFFSQVAEHSPSRHLPRSLFHRLDAMHPHRQEEIEERYGLAPTSKGKGKAASHHDGEDHDRHFEILIRMLYIFALLNPVHYVQGMSELIAPLYYVFAQSSEREHAEADTFWAFSFLMGEIGDFYVQDSDGSFGESHNADAATVGVAGLGAALRQFAKELHWIDSQLAYNLHTQMEIQPTFYALRWITCLLAQDFRIPDLIRVWDSLFAMFADSTRQAAKAVSAAESEARAFLLDVCVAMVLVKRHELLSSSFSACLNTLQNYVCEDVHTVLTLAFTIRERRITSSLTGIEISSFSSAPNSPIPDGGEYSTSTSPSVSLHNARQALSTAASNVSSTPTAKALRQRFFKQKEGDFADDASDVSSATAPGGIESNFASPVRSTTTSPATTIPSSASSFLNRYAKSFATSDAAAQLNKMTTNSYITALQWKDSAPGTFSKWKADVSTKVTGAAGAAKTVVRPPSPQNDPPFTPPTAYTGHWLSPEGSGSPGGIIGDRRGSGPKPLLLSSAARRASATLQQDMQPASPHQLASNASRRTSYSGPSSSNGSSLGLGLPRSLDNPIHAARTPSPTAQFRPDSHSRAASTSQLGSYRFGHGRNGHAEHIRAASLVGMAQSPSSYKANYGLSEIKEKELPTLDDEVPLRRLSISSSQASDEGNLPRPPPRPRRSIDRPQFSLLRDKAASNDLEVLNDSPGFGDDAPGDIVSTSIPTMSHSSQKAELSHGTGIAPVTPPQSPKQTYAPPIFATSESIPPSPGRLGSGLDRSVNRQPRTSSLGKVDTAKAGRASPPHVRSPTSSTDLTRGDSTASQRPSRRRLASSRRLVQRDSIDSIGIVGGDLDSPAEL